MNPTRATRIVYDARGSEIRLKSGESAHGVDLPENLVRALFAAQNDLEIAEHRPAPPRTGGAVVIDGMYGIGDNLHQRAVVRQLMEREQVWLHTSHWHNYHDLIGERLHLMFKPTRLRAQAKTIAREQGLFAPVPAQPPAAHHIKLWYRKDAIDKHGSILEAMAGNLTEQGHPVEKGNLDFSLPIPASWTAPKWDTGGKPILVYRPIVLRREWNSANRNPDPDGYHQLFQAAREGFFVVSIADLLPGEEWIVGSEEDADVKLHAGELDFPSMAALFREAALVFANAGFGPVLAQAVGTPSITVYGGRESFRTTQRAGAHLAPTLGIDPIRPCDCHTERHDCGDKRIDLSAALDRVRAFAREYAAKARQGTGGQVASTACRSRTLIFGTIRVDSPARQLLCEQWLTLHSALNPECDLLLVDSASDPPLTSASFVRPERLTVFDFGDNIGHLSRRGRDGWGRAFCKGLDLACECGYAYVVHVEGDSLLRVPARDLVAKLEASGKGAASIPVRGLEREFPGWVETGLMIFSTAFLKSQQLSKFYDWPRREARPTPELVVRHIIGEDNLLMLPLKGRRGDKQEITKENVVALDLDWLTHCHNDIECYARFVAANLPKAGGREAVSPPSSSSRVDSRTAPALKLNLGCGTNWLAGWDNRDADVDITKPLPWADETAAFIFAEHVVEHVSCHQAIGFFEQAYRVLAPGGVLRVVVPSLKQIMACEDQAYFDFTSKWSGEATRKGAAKAILFSHGHQMAWTADLMSCLLRYAGFVEVAEHAVGTSPHPELVGVEGHGKVIGEAFNRYESMCFEGTKPGTPSDVVAPRRIANVPETKIAVVVGGARQVREEIALTRTLLAGLPATWLVTNDMLAEFDGPCLGVTLHPNKVREWLTARQNKRLPAPAQVWAHNKGDPQRPFIGVTHVFDDARGSSGLFAVIVARQLGFERIILAGVPMDAAQGHFVRGPAPWSACQSFRHAWDHRRPQLAPFVRSWSGWTKQAFGEPDPAFLGVTQAAA